MSQKPDTNLAIWEWINRYSLGEGPIGYGAGSVDYGPRHKYFKQYGGPETDIPEGGNQFWNDIFGIRQLPTPPLNYDGKDGSRPKGKEVAVAPQADPLTQLFTELIKGA